MQFLFLTLILKNNLLKKGIFQSKVVFLKMLTRAFPILPLPSTRFPCSLSVLSSNLNFPNLSLALLLHLPIPSSLILSLLFLTPSFLPSLSIFPSHLHFLQFCCESLSPEYISMFKIRKLEIDSDKQDFPGSICFNQLQQTPQVLTFGPYRNNTDNSQHYLGQRQKEEKHNELRPISADSLSQFDQSFTSNRMIRSKEVTHRRSSRNSLGNHTFLNNINSTERELTLNKQLDQIQKTVDERKGPDCKLIFEKNNILEGIIKGQKIKKLQNNFIRKISRTSTAATPIQYNIIKDWQNSNVLNLTGIQLNPLVDNLLNLLSVFQIITLLVIYTISIVFEDLITNNPTLSTLQMGSLLFYLVEIALNLVSIKSEAGKKIVVIKEIISFYFSKSFMIDIMSFFILLLDISTSYPIISVFRLFIIFKLPQCLHKIEKLQVYFIRNIYNEQYWEFAKVFLVNFCFAHVIALFLAAMASLNSSQNWMTVKGIAYASWIQQYIWSYYWASNIMLTVGFGDIVASNSSQAVCLIFIETFSCIVMAYNINCVGEIITNIRSENVKRSKKFKIFKKLTDQSFVPVDLEFKINNYIEESSNLKKKFNHEDDKEFLNELPQTLRISYLREANKTVLKELVFFRDLLDRTLYNFAQHLQIKISHPQEIIRSIDDDFNLMILKKGEIGYICKKNGILNDQIVDLIKVGKRDAPFLTSLDFLSKKRPLYEIKSLAFSVLFKLDYTHFIQIFKQSDMDYQLFCFIRDKIRNIPDQFQVLPCEYCKKKFNHFKFTCPKLHYAPYEQHIIDKEIHKEKIGKNKRKKTDRIKNELLTPVEYFKKLKDYRNDEKLNRELSNQLLKTQKTKITNHIKQQISNNSTSQLLSSCQKIGAKKVTLTSDFFEMLIETKTKEIIEMQFLRREKKSEYDDQIWILQLDALTDYNSYFSQHNPNLLRERFNPDARMLKKMEKIQNYDGLQKGAFHSTSQGVEQIIRSKHFITQITEP